MNPKVKKQPSATLAAPVGKANTKSNEETSKKTSDAKKVLNDLVSVVCAWAAEISRHSTVANALTARYELVQYVMQTLPEVR